MAQTQNNVVASATGASAGGLATEHPARGRIVVLNALPLNAMPRRHIQLDVIPVAVQELAGWIQRRVAEGYEVVHFIRHSATIQALRVAGVPLQEQPNASLYTYSHGDLLVIVTLRTPQRSQEATQVSPNDLETWVVTVL